MPPRRDPPPCFDPGSTWKCLLPPFLSIPMIPPSPCCYSSLTPPKLKATLSLPSRLLSLHFLQSLCTLCPIPSLTCLLDDSPDIPSKACASPSHTWPCSGQCTFPRGLPRANSPCAPFGSPSPWSACPASGTSPLSSCTKALCTHRHWDTDHATFLRGPQRPCVLRERSDSQPRGVSGRFCRGALSQPPGSTTDEEKDYQDMICLGRKGGRFSQGEKGPELLSPAAFIRFIRIGIRIKLINHC